MTPIPPRRDNKGNSESEEVAIPPSSRGRSASEMRLKTFPQRSAWGKHLEAVLLSYADHRGISGQQLVVLRLYLEGKNDKEIADMCNCSGGTVYEHWRRMAKKSGGSLKSDVIADFHRFLGGA
jgi:DNA-binding CsgD family transcriptional regulator